MTRNMRIACKSKLWSSSIRAGLMTVIGGEVPEDVARMYGHMCPANVYEVIDRELRVNAPSCIDCKATDALGPRWTPRQGGSGSAARLRVTTSA